MADDSREEDALVPTEIVSKDEIKKFLPTGQGEGRDASGDTTHIIYPDEEDYDDETAVLSDGDTTNLLPGDIPSTFGRADTDRLDEDIVDAGADTYMGGGPGASTEKFARAETHVHYPTEGFDDFVNDGAMPKARSGFSLFDGEDDTTQRSVEDSIDPMNAFDQGEDDEDPLVGAELEGRFRIDELLGEGGMGKVYKGTQLSVGRPVAIKLVHRSISSEPAIRHRFMREAKLISSFTHPNTVRLYDFGETDGQLFIAMEFVEGVPLSEILEDGPVNLSFAFEVLDQVCGSLVEAHKSDVVHRDVKPENIVLSRSADDRLQVKLLDFGIAHVEPVNDGKKETFEDLTKRGAIVGTPEYMAPEQARGKVVKAATDVYSLGVILYEMASGKLPLRGSTNLETLFWQVTKTPPPITDHFPDCPKPLQKLIERLLEKDPDDRVSSATQVRSGLRKVRTKLSLPRVSDLEEGPIVDVLKALAQNGKAKMSASEARDFFISEQPDASDEIAKQPGLLGSSSSSDPNLGPGDESSAGFLAGGEADSQPDWSPDREFDPNKGKAPKPAAKKKKKAKPKDEAEPALEIDWPDELNPANQKKQQTRPRAPGSTTHIPQRDISDIYEEDNSKNATLLGIAGLIIIAILGAIFFLALGPSDSGPTPPAEDAAEGASSVTP